MAGLSNALPKVSHGLCETTPSTVGAAPSEGADIQRRKGTRPWGREQRGDDPRGESSESEMCRGRENRENSQPGLQATSKVTWEPGISLSNASLSFVNVKQKLDKISVLYGVCMCVLCVKHQMAIINIITSFIRMVKSLRSMSWVELMACSISTLTPSMKLSFTACTWDSTQSCLWVELVNSETG